MFDSNGPDLRIRGTAQQLFEKYLQLGRDATSSGDRVMAEGYFQHAEHYFRILNAMAQAAQQPQGNQQGAQQVSHPNNQQRGRPGDEQDGEDRGGDDPLISGSTPQPQAAERQPQSAERQPQPMDRQFQPAERQSQPAERQSAQPGERSNYERSSQGQDGQERRERQAPDQASERPAGDRPANERPAGDRPASERQAGERQAGEPRQRAPRQPRERPAPPPEPVASDDQPSETELSTANG